jgi:hypothetical protein
LAEYWDVQIFTNDTFTHTPPLFPTLTKYTLAFLLVNSLSVA